MCAAAGFTGESAGFEGLRPCWRRLAAGLARPDWRGCRWRPAQQRSVQPYGAVKAMPLHTPIADNPLRRDCRHPTARRLSTGKPAGRGRLAGRRCRGCPWRAVRGRPSLHRVGTLSLPLVAKGVQILAVEKDRAAAGRAEGRGQCRRAAAGAGGLAAGRSGECAADEAAADLTRVILDPPRAGANANAPCWRAVRCRALSWCAATRRALPAMRRCLPLAAMAVTGCR